MADEERTTRAQAWVDRVYTASADERQKALGLAYVTAERVDLAKELAKFAASEVERADLMKLRAY